jgi:glycerol-3-phosphate acyltransferase PlsY
VDKGSIILVCLAAYALGSIATAVWAGRLFHKLDIREYGSGNAGATNTIRVLGWSTGLPVLLIDIGKGWLAASLPVIFRLSDIGSPELVNMQILCGSIAIIGHIFPVFAGFKGGKGVATTFGVLLSLSPFVTISCFVVFLFVLLITGYVSVSSMSAGISFPVFLLFLFDTPSMVFKIFSILIGIAIVLTHKKNIAKLLKGEENKFLWKKRPADKSE